MKSILLVSNYKSDVGYAWWLMENFWATISLNFPDYNSILIYPEINDIPLSIQNTSIRVIQHDFSDFNFSAILNLKKLITTNNIEVVYLTDRSYYHFSYFLLRVWGVRVIIMHDHMPGERTKITLFKKLIKKSIHFFSIFSCNYYIAVSSFVKSRLVNVSCISSRKCYVVHNGIKIFDIQNDYYAHHNFNLPINAKIVVTTGRATYYKGVDLILKVAFEILVTKKYDNLFFLHIGSGPDLSEFKILANQYGIERQFIFAGFRNDVTKILPSCDIAIQMSQGEAFSLSILEYLCAGLPTLAPDNCGNPEAIEHGVTGFLFTPGDLSGVVDKICFLLDNPEHARSIGFAARKSVEEKFSIELCNEKFIKILKDQIC